MKPIKDMTNDEVDAAVLENIERGNVTFDAILRGLGGGPGYRIIDRSLQRLRKQNKAAFIDRRWCVR